MTLTLYKKPMCVQCDATVRKLAKLGLIEDQDYGVIDVTKDNAALEALKGLGYMQAPVVVLRNGTDDIAMWSGYRPDKIEKAVKEMQRVAA